MFQLNADKDNAEGARNKFTYLNFPNGIPLQETELNNS